MRWPDGIINSMDMSLSKLWEMVRDGEESRKGVRERGHMYMYECESWTLKKAESQRFDALTSLRVSWTARRSNQYILKEISPEYSLEGLMLKLKL